MRRLIPLAVFAATLALLSPRAARACGQGTSGNNYVLIEAIVAGAALDAGFTAFDGISALVDHHPGTGAGLFELAVAGPQLAIAGYAISVEMRTVSRVDGPTLIYAVWNLALTGHALWTLVSQPEEHHAPWAALAPTSVQLGQKSASGFGMVGRF